MDGILHKLWHLRMRRRQSTGTYQVRTGLCLALHTPKWLISCNLPLDGAFFLPQSRSRSTRSRAYGKEKAMADDEGLWEVADVAACLKVPEMSVYKMTRRGAPTPIPHVKLGGLLRFRRRDIDRWLDLLAVGNLDLLERTP